MHLKTVAIIAVLIALAAAPAAAQESESSSEWRYDAVLYGWLAGLEGTIGVGDQLEAPVDATFDDLLNYVDFAMAGHFEARNNVAVLLADISYTGLSSNRDAQIAEETVNVEMDLTQWIFELGGGYRVSKEFTALFTGRYYSIDMGGTSTSTMGGSSSEKTEGWGDLFVGGRYTTLLREKWILSARGDIGAGGSDFAWYGELTAGYRFTDLLSGLVAWKVLSVDRQPNSDGDYFKYDIVQSGLGIGLGFSF